MSRDEAQKASKQLKEKKAKDKRNLHLAEIGIIKEGSAKAEGIPKQEMEKRTRAWKEKKLKLASPNFHVSPTRLAVRNIPKSVDEKQLKEIFKKAGEGKIVQVKLVRDPAALDQRGQAMSRGFGFVEFSLHSDALKALHATNNKPNLIPELSRGSSFIVDFALENVLKLQKRKTNSALQTAKKELKDDDGNGNDDGDDTSRGLKRKRETNEKDDKGPPKKLSRGQRQRAKRRDLKTSNSPQSQTTSQQHHQQPSPTPPTPPTPSRPQQAQAQQKPHQRRQPWQRPQQGDQRGQRQGSTRPNRDRVNKNYSSGPRDHFDSKMKERKQAKFQKQAKKEKDFETLVKSYTHLLSRPSKKWDE
eukprot:TRINITY_DN3228_c0_g1_i2.p1 TRINITY_DN3228_c0_g1~~TRINITY_DN3228_c0_g1_i2.p1  ORF type:complete len:359 (-),score=113.53 TRINITY_DN3228_c0_g1_i2:397-1473(-)